MDFNYLQEYFYHEKDLMEKYYSTTLGNERSLQKIIDLEYPPSNRFKKLRKPYSQFILNQSENFWPIVPFTGSLFIELYPIKDKHLFQRVYGFSTHEIPEIIKFSQDTGKIQFVIPTKPQEFAGLDFYDPFFEELNVPLTLSHKSELIAGDTVEDAANEFDTMLKVGLNKHFTEKFLSKMTDSHKRMIADDVIDNVLQNTWKTYRDLRVLKFDDITSDAFDNSANNPEYVFDLLTFSSTFITQPILDGLHRKPVLSQNFLYQYHKKIKGNRLYHNENIQYKYEIGSFLMKKYILYPRSFEACKQMISLYDEYDLQSIYDALNKSIIAKDTTSSMDYNQQIDGILNTVWEEAHKVKKQRKIFKFEISLLLGVVGMQIGDLPGLLSTLGFTFYDKTSSNILEGYSNKLAEKLMEPYIVPILNFEDRYKIDS